MEFNILKGKFTKMEANQLNPLVLAFIGDAIYEIFIRTYLVNNNRNLLVHKLHLQTISFVKAQSQSGFMKKLQELLTEEEMSIYKRGRNTKSINVPKSADVQDYRIATGFEALLGFLYLTENQERLNYLLEEVLKIQEDQNDVKG